LLWQDVTQQAVKRSKSLLDLILIAKRSSTSAHLLMLCIASAQDANIADGLIRRSSKQLYKLLNAGTSPTRPNNGLSQ
jgi:hypothetical protein